MVHACQRRCYFPSSECGIVVGYREMGDDRAAGGGAMQQGFRVWIVAALAGLLSVATNVTLARANDCGFVLGFASLAALIPQQAGTCLQDEQHNQVTGDGQQQTTTGLLVWRKADNWTAFTDGYRTWVSGPHALQQRLNNQHFAWEGAGSGAGPQLVAPDPVQLLHDYYDLINRKEYSAAYALWSSPPGPYDQFAAGYSTTLRVEVAFGQPRGDSAAGHLGVDIPAVIIAQVAGDMVRSFAGYYIVTTPNRGVLPIGTPPQPWMIQHAEIHAVPGMTRFTDPAAQAALTDPYSP